MWKKALQIPEGQETRPEHYESVRIPSGKQEQVFLKKEYFTDYQLSGDYSGKQWLMT